MNMIRDCGSPAWLAIFVAMIAFIAAVSGLVVSFVVKSKAPGIGIGIVALMLSISVGTIGLLGRTWGLSQMEKALQGEAIDPSQKAAIRQEGTFEAAQCVSTGLIFMVLPLLISGAALAVALFKKSPQT